MQIFFFFLHYYLAHRDLHSFPTRRSSDLILLAGVLTSTALYSVSLFVMGSGNLSLGSAESLTTWAERLGRSEEHTSELQSHVNLVCRLLLEKKNDKRMPHDLSHLGFLAGQ